ncbi:protein of unknown function [Clostridium beijerinckii]|nr:protein of unknown function [Clostridium beijerinckii]
MEMHLESMCKLELVYYYKCEWSFIGNNEGAVGRTIFKI